MRSIRATGTIQPAPPKREEDRMAKISSVVTVLEPDGDKDYTTVTITITDNGVRYDSVVLICAELGKTPTTKFFEPLLVTDSPSTTKERRGQDA